MSIGSNVDDIIKGFGKAFKGDGILESNKAINAFTGTAEYIGNGLSGGSWGGQGFAKVFANNADDMYRKNADGIMERTKTKANWNSKKIAGSAIATAGAARVLSGGGVYKDGNGNTNLAAVPFV